MLLMTRPALGHSEQFHGMRTLGLGLVTFVAVAEVGEDVGGLRGALGGGASDSGATCP